MSRVRNLQARRAWWAKNKERLNAKQRAATEDEKAKRRRRNREWYANMTPAQRLHAQRYHRNNGLKLRHGITLAQWQTRFRAQGEACACCGEAWPSGAHPWHVDHDHTTGAVRGIVCVKCNTTLGQLGDTANGIVQWANRFLTYLGMEPTWRDGGAKRAGPNDRLVPWEPS